MFALYAFYIVKSIFSDGLRGLRLISLRKCLVNTIFSQESVIYVNL